MHIGFDVLTSKHKNDKFLAKTDFSKDTINVYG